MSISTGSNDYDEVIQLADGETFDGTNTSGDTLAGPNPLTVGKDYQVKKIIVELVMAPEQPEQGGDSDAATITTETGIAHHQLSIRSSYADTGSDGELSSGVAYNKITTCNPPGVFEDQTNGAGGGYGAISRVQRYEIDIEDVPMWSGSLEEGAELSMNWKVEGITGSLIQLWATNHLYVVEK